MALLPCPLHHGSPEAMEFTRCMWRQEILGSKELITCRIWQADRRTPSLFLCICRFTEEGGPDIGTYFDLSSAGLEVIDHGACR